MPAFPLKFCLRSFLLPRLSFHSLSVKVPSVSPRPRPCTRLGHSRSVALEWDRGALRSPDWTTRLFVVLRRESECGSKSDKSRQLQMPQQGSATLPVEGIWTVCHKWPFKDWSMIICSDSYLRLHCTSKHYYYEQDTSILGACCEKNMNLIVFLHLGNFN